MSIKSSYYLLFVMSVLLYSCEKVEFPNDDTDNTQNEELIVEDDSQSTKERNGSKDYPFTADDLSTGSVGLYITTTNSSKNDCWVEGYIVGYINGTNINNAVFDAGDKETNILLASSPNETDIKKVVPVQLSTGTSYIDARSALNLHQHPENLKRKVTVLGKLCTYMSVAGIKNTRDYFVAEPLALKRN